MYNFVINASVFLMFNPKLTFDLFISDDKVNSREILDRVLEFKIKQIIEYVNEKEEFTITFQSNNGSKIFTFQRLEDKTEWIDKDSNRIFQNSEEVSCVQIKLANKNIYWSFPTYKYSSGRSFFTNLKGFVTAPINEYNDFKQKVSDFKHELKDKLDELNPFVQMDKLDENNE